MRRYLLVLLALVLAGCGSDSTSTGADPSTTQPPKAPVVGDHWHVAVGFSRCGEALPEPSDDAEDRHGIHTHGDGLIHLHPVSYTHLTLPTNREV